MRNSSISDYVASAMDSVLKSSEHQSLYNSRYKVASDENAVNDENLAADVNNAEDANHVHDEQCAHDEDDKSDTNCADDKEDKKSDMEDKDCGDMSYANDNFNVDAFDVALDGLLTASAALDKLNLPNSATISLRLATVLSETKNKVSKANAFEEEELNKMDQELENTDEFSNLNVDTMEENKEYNPNNGFINKLSPKYVCSLNDNERSRFETGSQASATEYMNNHPGCTLWTLVADPNSPDGLVYVK